MLNSILSDKEASEGGARKCVCEIGYYKRFVNVNAEVEKELSIVTAVAIVSKSYFPHRGRNRSAKELGTTTLRQHSTLRE